MRDSVTRWVLVIGVVVVMSVLSGCTVFSPGAVDETRLNQNVSYDWETTANTTVVVESNRYKVVHRVGNRSEIRLFQFEQFNNERPLNPVGVKFQFDNGTVVGHEAMRIEKTRSHTIVTFPASTGSFAYSHPKTGKQLRLPIVNEGSYEMSLPQAARVQYPLIGRVVPPADDLTMREDRVVLSWSDPSGRQLTVRYYLVRDLWIFGGLLVIAITAIIGVLSYYWLQLQALKERREAVDWDR